MKNTTNESKVQNVKKWYDAFTYGKPQKATIFNPKFSQSMAKTSDVGMPELIVDWSNAVIVKSGEKTIIEAPVSGNFGFSTDAEKYNKDNPNATTSLIILTTAKSRSAYFMSVISSPGYKEKVTYVNQPRSFNGSLIYHTLQGQLVAVQIFKDGAVVGIGTPTDTRQSAISKPSEIGPRLVGPPIKCLTYDVYSYWKVCVQDICEYHSEYVRSYTVCSTTGEGSGGGGGDPGDGGGGGGGGTSPDVPCIQGTVFSLGPVPMALGIGVNVAGPNPPTAPGDPEPPAPPVPCQTPTVPPTIPPIMLLEVNITELKPCAQTVYNSISNITGGFSEIFAMFNSARSAGYNWTLKNGTLAGDINGTTNDDRTKKTVTTTIDLRKYSDGTDIALARTILHEAAHAYLVRHFAMNPNAANDTYKELVDLYYNTFKGNLGDAHHEAFVNDFVNKIAQTLMAYGDLKGYNFSDPQEKIQFYQNMAWGGLEDTNAFKALNETKRNEISNALRVEQYNTNMSGFKATQKGTKLGC